MFIDNLEKFNLEKQIYLQSGECSFTDKELSALRTKRKNADHAKISKLRRMKRTADLLEEEAFLKKEYKRSQECLNYWRAMNSATRKRINYYTCMLAHYKNMDAYKLPPFLVFKKN